VFAAWADARRLVKWIHANGVGAIAEALLQSGRLEGKEVEDIYNSSLRR